MQRKYKEKEKAVMLRMDGKTYSEILEVVDVSKSTLSLWLREVGLAKEQKQRISAKRRAAQERGAAARKRDRMERTLAIYEKASKEVRSISKRELMLIGATLYWTEGSKEKSHQIGNGIDFANTDPEMIKIFIKWLREILEIQPEKIYLSLYIHENSRTRVKEVSRYWEKIIGISGMRISHVYFKRHNPKTNRKKIGNHEYFGTLRVRVRGSSDLQRRTQGWIYGITGASCRIV